MANEITNKIHLSFTIGPVQTFVAQARRTRDLWAGSWLLSYLTETALTAAEKAEGIAVIPFRKKEDRNKITSVDTVIGGIPNRIEVAFETKEHAKAAAIKVKEALQKAWEKVADEVYSKYVKPVVEKGHNTKKIWDRQVNNFWEISWVIDCSNEGKPLSLQTASRKNIRSANANDEPGVKCSLMGTLQEISGHYGKGKQNQQKDFWREISQGVLNLDLKEGERLCAIALIKRLFPFIVKETIDKNVCHDLAQQQSYPSTAFLSVLPWLREITQSDELKKAAEIYAASAKEAGWKNSEHQAAKDANLPKWAALDAPAWFASAIRQNEPQADENTVCKLLKQLKGLYEQIDKKPVPYYAMLLMDGDSMGKLVASSGSTKVVSKGLGEFSPKVKQIVTEHDGRTIYAGGDDVLALLPAQQALAAADEMSKEYTHSFPKNSRATLSGAIVYAHWKYPLRQVLRTAHDLLDDIAKERTGRDSLAIGIIQGSGLQAIWSVPWKVVRGEDGNGFGKLTEVIDHFETSTDSNSKTFNASFLYHLREQFAKLFPKQNEIPGVFQQVDFPSDDGQSLLLDLAHAEYRRRMSNDERKQISTETTKEEVKPLLALSHQWTRNEETAGIKCNKNSFSFDGWRVARFLKQIKDGKVDDHG